ncbi:MAG TPA: HDOD domain-containing protein [Noviherbaspirillum sp.]|nr:HDOD domain-containing protein [Noviherbaspirillum sp.]
MNSSVNTQATGADQVMTLLWSRVRQRGDLPGFSKVVSSIIGAMRGDDDSEFNMTKTVLQDPTLTQKVLRLANSAMYSVFGQNINTISKAVVVLGTDAIGHLALGLKLVDGLSAVSSETASTRAEMEKAVLAGHIARQVASSTSARDAEEAVVCSMLHSLGRMMAAFYLPDLWSRVQARCTEAGIDENQAAREILGLGFDDIGRNAAQHWGLPSGLVDTLRDVPPKPVGEPLDHKDWLATISTLSSHCAIALCADNAGSGEKIASLAGSYAEMLGLEPEQVVAAVDTAQRTAVEEDAPLVRQREGVGTLAVAALINGKPADAAGRLKRGVADMQGPWQSANTAQLMSMALEIVYQGLGFSRAVVFLLDKEKAQYTAHMCFGDDVQELLPRLVFDDAYQPDVFHASLANDKMIFVENAHDPAFIAKVPRWWKEALPTVRSFMVLPLTANRRPLGFIYGDWDMSKPASKIEQQEIAPLNEIRTLVMQAIEQRRLTEASWPRKSM